MAERACKVCGTSLDGSHHSVRYCKDCKTLKRKKPDVIGDHIQVMIDRGATHAVIMQTLAVIVTRMMER